jgi:hypothetical protein
MSIQTGQTGGGYYHSNFMLQPVFEPISQGSKRVFRCRLAGYRFFRLFNFH